MLLYDGEDERSSTEIDCIKNALAAGHFCVYATVDAKNKEFVENLATRIESYQDQIDQGNLKIVNFMPFYDSAAKGDLTPFKLLKGQVEGELQNRNAAGKSGKALLVADAACNLSRNVRFDECVSLEAWWQDTYKDWMAKNLDITIICAHPSSVLKQVEHRAQHERISHVHSLTLDLHDFMNDGKKVADSGPRTIKILVAEPESDIRAIYSRYLQSLAVSVDAVESGRECLEKAILMPEKRGSYDLIIIDSHIKDASGLHISRKILEENPDQQIAFTTTWDIRAMRSELAAYSFDDGRYPVIQKPFRFSQLLSVISLRK